MSLIARYSDKHTKKIIPLRASSNEDKYIKNRETYVNYLETQVEKAQNLNEAKIFQLEKIILEHDEKFENVIRLIRLLQAFAESQDQENNKIKTILYNQQIQSPDQELLNLKTIVQNNDRAVNQCSQCIGELQNAYQEIEKNQAEFEQKVEDFVQKVSNDLNNDFKQLQNTVTPRIDLTNIEQQLNKKIEVIVTELRQTALRKDVSQVEFRLKKIEQQMPQSSQMINQTQLIQKSQNHLSSLEADEQTLRIKKEVEELRLVLSQCLSDQKKFKNKLKAIQYLILSPKRKTSKTPAKAKS